MLVEVGYAGITTRALADKAGVNNGLVHYYFGSMEEVFVQVLERFTDRVDGSTWAADLVHACNQFGSGQLAGKSIDDFR